MIAWTKRGNAVVGAVALEDGRKGSAVIVGPRTNPKGVALVVPKGSANEMESMVLADGVAFLSPDQVFDIICMQERLHGSGKLPKPIDMAN